MKTKASLLVISLLTFCLQSINSYSANRYWIATSPANWNNTANWSASSGGAGGVSVPSTNDDVNFDGNGFGNCTITVVGNVQVRSITVNASYPGTLNQGPFVFTVINAAQFSGGSFSGSNSQLNFQSGFTISGTNFTSTSGRLESFGSSSLSSGSFVHNNGTVRLEQDGATLIIAGSFIFNNLEIAGPYFNTTLQSSIQVMGNLLFDSTDGSLNIDSSPGVIITVFGNVTTSADGELLILDNLTLDVHGNFTQNNSCACGGGSSTIRFIGIGNQAFSSSAPANQGYLSSVIINKSSGVLTLSGIITITGTTWALVSGITSPTTSTIVFSQENVTISGDQSFHNVTLYPAYTTVTISDDLILTGDLLIDGATDNDVEINGSVIVNGSFRTNGTNRIVFNTGTIYARGDIYTANTGQSVGGSGTLRIDGTGNQYFDGSTVSGRGVLPNITINKSSGTLTLGSNPITYNGYWNYLGGNVDASSNLSTVFLNTTIAQTINAPAASMAFHNFILSIPFRSLTLQSPIDFNGSLTITGNQSTLNTSTFNYAVNIGGNLTVNTGAAFNQNSSIVTFDGGGNQTYSTASTLTFPLIVINKSSGSLILQSPVIISNQLTLTSGTITTTSTNFIQLTSGATTNIGNSTSYIDGPMRYLMASATTRTLNFPIGKAGAWRPAVLTTTHSTGASATYSAELINSSASALGYTLASTTTMVSAIRYWQIDRTGANNFSNATLQLYYGSDDIFTHHSSLRIAKTNGAGTTWINVGGTGSSAGSGTITSTLFTTFSKFALAETDTPLPISLSYFKANFAASLNQIQFEWATESEKNNDRFAIQQMAADHSFTDIHEIPSKGINGNSEKRLSYKYDYLNSDPGDHYFRLSQTDFDGRTTYSEVIKVNIPSQFSIYPNPVVNNQMTIRLPDGIREASYQCIITNMLGKVLFNDILSDLNNKNEIEMYLRDIAPGNYIIRLSTTKNNLFGKFTVK